MARVRSRIGTKHQLGMTAQYGPAQGVAVPWCFGDGFAEKMRLQEASGNIIQGQHEMMEGDGSRHIGVLIQQIQRCRGGNMFHNQAKSWKIPGQLLIDLQKFSFPVHDKAIAFTVHQKRNIQFFKQGDGRHDGFKIAYPRLALGGDSRRIKFYANNFLPGGDQFLPTKSTKKERHVRDKGRAGAGCDNGMAICGDSVQTIHRLHQIGHHNRPGESLGRKGCHQLEHVLLAQVEVHIQGRVKFQHGSSCQESRREPHSSRAEAGFFRGYGAAICAAIEGG